MENKIQFQRIYQNKANGMYYRTVGYALSPVDNKRIIIYRKVGLEGTPYYREEEEFLYLFRYIGA